MVHWRIALFVQRGRGSPNSTCPTGTFIGHWCLRAHSGFTVRQACCPPLSLLAGLHRAADGSLIGVFTAVLALSGLTLHWQYRWTVAFERLEDTRAVGHRLTESTAMLERYLLDQTQTPNSMVPTTAEKLVYLERPIEEASGGSHDHLAFIGSLMDRSIHHGY